MRAGGGADAGDRAPAAARGWELAGARLTGVPGLEDERILAREGLRTTRNPPVQLEQSSQAWTGLAMARGGWRGGAFAGTGVGRFWGSGPSAKRKGPVYGFSPRARGGRSGSGEGSAAGLAAAQRRRLTGARGEGAAELAPALDLLNKARGRAANENRGSVEPESHRLRGIGVAEGLPAARSW